MVRTSSILRTKFTVNFRTLCCISNNTDLFDTPLINLGNEEYVLIPSLVAYMDIARILMCNFLKKKTKMDFKGDGFENKVLDELNNESILCCGLNTKGVSKQTKEERQFQCDVAFVLDSDLYLCECKSYLQPTTHRGFYELLEKKQYTADNQFNEISEFYLENIDTIRKKMNLSKSWSPRKVYKIIILTPPNGSRERYNDIYFIDYSAFSTFIQRSKPSLVDISGKVRYELNLFSVFEGKVSSSKLLSFLKNPPQIVLEKKRRKRVTKQIPFGDLILKKFDFQTKFDDKISLTDENLKKYLDKVGKSYFNK